MAKGKETTPEPSFEEKLAELLDRLVTNQTISADTAAIIKRGAASG